MVNCQTFYKFIWICSPQGQQQPLQGCFILFQLCFICFIPTSYNTCMISFTHRWFSSLSCAFLNSYDTVSIFYRTVQNWPQLSSTGMIFFDIHLALVIGWWLLSSFRCPHVVGGKYGSVQLTSTCLMCIAIHTVPNTFGRHTNVSISFRRTHFLWHMLEMTF